MIDLLLPATDGGVVVQAVLWIAVVAIALYGTRRKPDLRLLTIGVGTLGIGLKAVRAVH